jgi:hypothetical protein
VRRFVEQYFTWKARTPDQLAAQEAVRYVSREELMKAEVRLAAVAKIDGEHQRTLHRFINMAYDAYVHGAYETAMELCDPIAGRFLMRGHPDGSKREEFVEAVFRTLHQVVVAVELTAAVTSHAPVFQAAREARRTMDASEPWKLSDDLKATIQRPAARKT